MVQLRYVVIGAGAIGGAIGVRLHEAGRDVVLVARGRHLEAIQSNGLRLDEPDRSRTVRLPAVARVAEVDWQAGDAALLCVKTQDSVDVLDELRRVAPDVPIVCMQNGVANERFAAARFLEVQAVCVQMSAEHLEPGWVVGYSSPVPGLLDVGKFPQGVDPVSERIASDLGAAGFDSRTDRAIMRWKYRKLLMNLGNAVEAVCGRGDPGLPTLNAALRAEGERCLTAAGLAFASMQERSQRRGGLLTIHPVGGRLREGGSTWQSLRRGLGLVEADFLNGEIVELGRRHGIPTPVNKLVLDVVIAMARDRKQPGGRRGADLVAEAGVEADTSWQ